jgi:uncharacterized membrane protein YjfL (UPF0719 family)
MDEPFDPYFWDRLLHGVILTLVFGLLGIGLTVLGFKVFDLITPRIDIQRELAEKNNIAVAIVCAAIILGICYVVAAAV